MDGLNRLIYRSGMGQATSQRRSTQEEKEDHWRYSYRDQCEMSFEVSYHVERMKRLAYYAKPNMETAVGV